MDLEKFWSKEEGRKKRENGEVSLWDMKKFVEKGDKEG